MIKYLLTKRLELIWVVFHVVLGLISTSTPYFFIFWMYTILGTSFLGLLLNRNRDGIMTYTLAYLLGTEVFSRMARAPITGIYPDEVGKYFPLFVLLATFLIEGKIRSKSIGWTIILLTVPSLVLVDAEYIRYGIVFNYLGIFNLALMIIYFMPKNINLTLLNQLFKLIIYGLIAVLAFITIKTPNLSEIEFELSALTATSGGYGTNQVSTVLGVGFMIMFYFFITGQRLFSIQYLDKTLLFYFIFRALITFSRGGVLVPAIGLLIFYYILSRHKNFKIGGNFIKKFSLGQIISIGAITGIIFFATNQLTGGQLLLRYQGETAGTIKGVKEVDLNHWTSNRVDIALMDLGLWIQNPVFGVGPGMSKFTEGGHFGFGSHVEFSRLPAEHGFGGVIVVLLLLFYPFYFYKRLTNPLNKALFAMFIWLALMTSFHAAMRTMVTPFFFGLAFARFDLSEKR